MKPRLKEKYEKEIIKDIMEIRKFKNKFFSEYLNYLVSVYF